MVTLVLSDSLGLNQKSSLIVLVSQPGGQKLGEEGEENEA